MRHKSVQYLAVHVVFLVIDRVGKHNNKSKFLTVVTGLWGSSRGKSGVME